VDKNYAKKILDKLIELDKQTTNAYYVMGQLLHALHEASLHQVLGYDSFSHLVTEELSFAPSTAHSYRKMYARFRELKYSKTEALEALHQFGITPLNKVLPDLSTKLGVRGLKRRIDALDLHQINFMCSTSEFEEVQQALFAMGADISDDGRMQHSSDAFMAIIRSIKIKKRAA
jgi:hypothetical protein